jgi:hypothetical protein
MTAEQLRRRALAHAEARGRGVAKRRTLRREIGYSLWSYVFPVIGLGFSMAFLALASVYFWSGPGKFSELVLQALPLGDQIFSVPGNSSELSLTILRLDRTLGAEIPAPESLGAGTKVKETPALLTPRK